MAQNENTGLDDEEIDYLEEDYYGIFNLHRNATDKEITQAYHRFGLIYHPDKQLDEENKRNAEMLFAKIKKAYDVLIDPHKRAIYDTVGTKGLKHSGWQIISRTKTPKEIREEYERLEKENRERRLRELTNSQGYFNMRIDATDFFRELNENEEERVIRIRINDFAISQGLNIPLTNKDTASVNIDMINSINERRSSSEFNVSLRRIVSTDSWIECGTTLGNTKNFELKGFRQLSQRCNVSLSGMFLFRKNALYPSLSATISYQMSKNLTGSLNWKTGLKSHMKTMASYAYKDYRIDCACQLSLKNSYLSCELSRAFMNNDLILRSSIRLGYLGLMFDYGIKKRITEFSYVGANIMVGNKFGVFLNIRIDRATQSFIFPIHLSNEILPSAIFYGSAAPIALYFIIKQLIVAPYLKDKNEKDAKEKQERLKSELQDRKREALAAQELMKEAYSRSIERESPNGLIIIKGIYGKLSDNLENIENEYEKTINVAVPLQVLIKDHKLDILIDTKKSDLQGFYDPCIGETKSLYINYKFNNQTYEAVFEDNQIVRIPQKSHLVSS